MDGVLPWHMFCLGIWMGTWIRFCPGISMGFGQGILVGIWMGVARHGEDAPYMPGLNPIKMPRQNPIQVPRQCPGKTSGMTGAHSHSARVKKIRCHTHTTPTSHPLSGITPPPFSFAQAFARTYAWAKAGTLLKVFDGNTLP